jgi:uncharacterized protein YcfJ
MATAIELAAMGLIPAGVYGANALASNGDERWDRTAVNTVGNLAGGLSGYRAFGGGIPGVLAGTIGALGGGYISDRLADLIDPTNGKVSATALLNSHLENDPMAQEAMYQEKIRQVRLMQQEQERQKILNYKAQMAQMAQQEGA